MAATCGSLSFYWYWLPWSCPVITGTRWVWSNIISSTLTTLIQLALQISERKTHWPIKANLGTNWSPQWDSGNQPSREFPAICITRGYYPLVIHWFHSKEINLCIYLYTFMNARLWMGCSKNWSHIAYGIVAETSGEISPPTKQYFDTFESTWPFQGCPWSVCLHVCCMHLVKWFMKSRLYKTTTSVVQYKICWDFPGNQMVPYSC